MVPPLLQFCDLYHSLRVRKQLYSKQLYRSMNSAHTLISKLNNENFRKSTKELCNRLIYIITAQPFSISSIVNEKLKNYCTMLPKYMYLSWICRIKSKFEFEHIVLPSDYAALPVVRACLTVG